MELKLTNKTVLITGASKGIGLAVAEVFAAEGCHLHLAARNEDVAIDYRETAPRDTPPDVFLDANGAADPAKSLGLTHPRTHV